MYTWIPKHVCMYVHKILPHVVSCMVHTATLLQVHTYLSKYSSIHGCAQVLSPVGIQPPPSKDAEPWKTAHLLTYSGTVGTLHFRKRGGQSISSSNTTQSVCMYCMYAHIILHPPPTRRIAIINLSHDLNTVYSGGAHALRPVKAPHPSPEVTVLYIHTKTSLSLSRPWTTPTKPWSSNPLAHWSLASFPGVSRVHFMVQLF